MVGNQHNLGWPETKRSTRLQRKTGLILLVRQQSQIKNKAQTKGRTARAMSERNERAALPNTQEDWRKNEMCREEEEGGGDLQVWASRAGCYTTQNRK